MTLALCGLSIVAVGMWLLSVRLKNVAIVDCTWGLFFCWIMFCTDFSSGPRGWLMFSLVWFWGMRLSIYLTWRSYGKSEDRRYTEIRKHHSGFWWKSLFIIFGFQAIIAFIVALPLQLSDPSTELNGLDLIGVSLWAIGFFFEVVGDWQLSKFLSKPSNKNAVLNTGLWAWTRHPNYFGDACIWWGLGIIGIAGGAPLISFASVLLMTWLLRKFSGADRLETTISNRRPGYKEYIEKTPAFIPNPFSKKTV